jgi:hypothetical protein
MQLSVVSTFIYFYCYATLKVRGDLFISRLVCSSGLSSRTQRRDGRGALRKLVCVMLPLRPPQHWYRRATGRPLRFLPNLLLASAAGVANVLITMPLDVVVTR